MSPKLSFLGGGKKWDKLPVWRKMEKKDKNRASPRFFVLKTKSRNRKKRKTNNQTKDNTFGRTCFSVFRFPFCYLFYSSSSYYSFYSCFSSSHVYNPFSFLFFFSFSPCLFLRNFLLSVLYSFFSFFCLSVRISSFSTSSSTTLSFSPCFIVDILIVSCFSSPPFLHLLLDLLLCLIFLVPLPVNTSCLQFGRPPPKKR